MFKKYIGDKKFYLMILSVALPIMAQSGISTLVSLIDNVMLGKLGTLPMSAVSITNQLLLIFNLATFGAVNGAGVFGAQYAGKKDAEGVKNCYALKLIITIMLSLIFIGVFMFFGENLINTYLDPNLNSAADIALTLNYAKTYLLIVLVSLIPFGLKEAMSSSIRENGDTVIPMIGSSVALITNMVLNYLLIFGKFGFPELGVAGAAIATVIARILELLILYVLALRKRKQFPFIVHSFKGLTITFNLVKDIVITGAPLMLNEILWSVSLAGINQCYSMRSLVAVAAINIVTIISNLYYVVGNALGMSISYIVGNILGTGDSEKAYDTDLKLIFFSFWLCCFFGIVFTFVSPLFPELYNTTTEIKKLSTIMLQISAIKLPIQAIYMSAYFTLKAGGKTFITFLFDSVFTTVLCWPLAYVLAKFTAMDIVMLYLMVQLTDLLKAVLGYYLVKKGVWVKTLVNQ